MIVPDGTLVAGIPARVVRELAGQARRWVETNPSIYRELARRHAARRPPRPVERARWIGSRVWNIAH